MSAKDTPKPINHPKPNKHPAVPTKTPLQERPGNLRRSLDDPDTIKR